MTGDRYTYRITWVDGGPHLQRAARGQLWREGEILRPATREELDMMYAGKIGYDPSTEPGRLAWLEHVRRGGD